MPSRIDPLRIGAYTVVSSIGAGRAATLDALRACRSGLKPNDFGDPPVATWVGRVPGLEQTSLPATLAGWDSRNNRLAWLALAADGFSAAVAVAKRRYGSSRVAVLVGTSTSSIGATEDAYTRLGPRGQFPADMARPDMHNPHSLGAFVQQALGLTGVCATTATACSSSAKVFAQAERFLRVGIADAAVVGGVDTLCGSVLYGFNSLELTSPEPCRPFDLERRGISLGEAAGFALLERVADSGPWFVGYGESSDAYHMSSPHPEGAGARLAVADALARSGIEVRHVDYINLHGTASRKNDEVEAGVVASIFPATTCASSTKGWTGHTLGAAGIVESVITLMALEHGLAPGTLNCVHPDPAFGSQLLTDNVERRIDVALSFSFGFGGSNCVLGFARNPS